MAGALVALSLGCSERPKDDGAPALPALAPASAAAIARAPAASEVNPRLLRRFQPLPASFDDAKNVRTPEKVALGRTLYFDPRLSKDGDLSCNSCHALDDYGVDHQRFSMVKPSSTARATRRRSTTRPGTSRSSGTGARRTSRSKRSARS